MPRLASGFGVTEEALVALIFAGEACLGDCVEVWVIDSSAACTRAGASIFDGVCEKNYGIFVFGVLI